MEPGAATGPWLGGVVLLGVLVLVIVVDFGLLLEGGPLLPGVPEVTSGICKGLVIKESRVCELTILGFSSFSGILLERMASRNSLNWSEGVGSVSGSLTGSGVVNALGGTCLSGELFLSTTVSTREFLFRVLLFNTFCCGCVVLGSLMGFKTSSGILC